MPEVLAVPGIRMTEVVGIYVSFNRPSSRAAEVWSTLGTSVRDDEDLGPVMTVTGGLEGTRRGF